MSILKVNMQNWKKIFNLIMLIILNGLFFIYALSPFIFRPYIRYEITTLFNQLEIGMSKEQVKQTFSSKKYLFLKLKICPGNRWFINTPLEATAGNWVLYIEFSNSKVSTLKIRLQDGEKFKPSEAPPDKILKAP